MRGDDDVHGSDPRGCVDRALGFIRKFHGRFTVTKLGAR
jgi:hypothetical protein